MEPDFEQPEPEDLYSLDFLREFVAIVYYPSGCIDAETFEEICEKFEAVAITDVTDYSVAVEEREKRDDRDVEEEAMYDTFLTDYDRSKEIDSVAYFLMSSEKNSHLFITHLSNYAKENQFSIEFVVSVFLDKSDKRYAGYLENLVDTVKSDLDSLVALSNISE